MEEGKTMLDLERVAKVGGLALAAISVIGGSLRGAFITRGECRQKSSLCTSGLQRELESIRNELKDGHRRFESTSRYIAAIGAKLGIKEDDILNP